MIQVRLNELPLQDHDNDAGYLTHNPIQHAQSPVAGYEAQ